MAGLVGTAMGAMTPLNTSTQATAQPTSTTASSAPNATQGNGSVTNSVSPDAVPNSPSFDGKTYSGQDFTSNPTNTPTFDTSTYKPPAAPTAAGYNANQQTVDPSKQTVEGQLQGVLSSGSPLIDSAKANVAEQYNARGLVNSSMQAGAATNAALEAALPIAQQNAQEYSNVASANQQATNVAQAQQTAGEQLLQSAETQGGIQSAQSAQSATQSARLSSISQSINSALQAQTATEASGASAQSATQNSVMDTFHTMLSSQQQQVVGSSSAAQSVVQGLQSQVAAILADPNIAQADKSGLIARLMDSAQNSVTAIGSIMNLDFSQLLGGSQSAATPTSKTGGVAPRAIR